MQVTAKFVSYYFGQYKKDDGTEGISNKLILSNGLESFQMRASDNNQDFSAQVEKISEGDTVNVECSLGIMKTKFANKGIVDNFTKITLVK